MNTTKKLLENVEEQMEKTILHTVHCFSKIKAGKASPNMLESVVIDYYGSPTPLSQIATIATPDARTLSIKPWEKSFLQEIERAIINSDLGFNPQNDGENIRINIPTLTEERRILLVKQVKQEAENGKIGIRNARKDVNNQLKNLQKEGMSEDEISNSEDTVQEYTNKYCTQIDDLTVKKEEEIMQV